MCARCAREVAEGGFGPLDDGRRGGARRRRVSTRAMPFAVVMARARMQYVLVAHQVAGSAALLCLRPHGRSRRCRPRRRSQCGLPPPQRRGGTGCRGCQRARGHGAYRPCLRPLLPLLPRQRSPRRPRATCTSPSSPPCRRRGHASPRPPGPRRHNPPSLRRRPPLRRGLRLRRWARSRPDSSQWTAARRSAS